MRWSRLFRRARTHDLDDEVAHYLEMSAAEYVRSGLSRDEATRRARVDFGGVEAAKEGVRTAGWQGALDTLLRDVRYAFRGFRSAPGYSLLAVAMLGTGMALSTSVLTAASTMFNEQWTVREPERIFRVINARGGPILSPAAARFLGEHATRASAISVSRCLGGMFDECQLEMDGAPATIDLVSGNYFAALGLPMQQGRGFASDEDRIETPSAVVVLSDAAWRTRFGADRGIVGRRIRIEAASFVVVGVAPPGFTGTTMEPRDAWLPISAMLVLRPGRPEVRQQLTTPAPGRSDAGVAVRLAPNATREEAEAELNALARDYRVANNLEDRGIRLVPTSYFPNPAKLNKAGAMFALLFCAVTLVLVLACANVGNLMLARAFARRREIAVRLALGASRGRVVRQLLIESLLLAVAAASIGLLAALRLPALMMTAFNGPVSWHFEPDGRVIVSALGLTIITCLAFGLAPALHATRTDVAAVLKAGSDRRSSMSGSSLRGWLLAAQIAIGLFLVANAALLVRAVQRGRDQDFGFISRGVAIVSFHLPASYDPGLVRAFTRQLAGSGGLAVSDRIALGDAAPLGPAHGTRVTLPGADGRDEWAVQSIEMSPGYLAVLGMPVVAGHDLTASDGENAVLVNETLARRLWPGESPLGKTIIDGAQKTVVGVVRDAELSRLDRVDPAVFGPMTSGRAPIVLLRAPSPGLLAGLSATALRIDPRITVQVDSVMGNVERQLRGFSSITEMAAALGVIAVVLASVGVFGVFGYVVEQRGQEIGIRTALGATPGSIIALILRDTLRPVAAGIGIGLAAAFAGAAVMRSELYGTSPLDPVALAMTAVVLTVAAVVATYVPARRAIGIDPVSALRQD